MALLQKKKQNTTLFLLRSKVLRQEEPVEYFYPKNIPLLLDIIIAFFPISILSLMKHGMQKISTKLMMLFCRSFPIQVVEKDKS